MRFALLLTLVLSLTSSVLFSDTSEDLTPIAGELLRGNFRVREHVKVILDGSEAASGISRISQFTNEVIYLSPQKWRARRDFPFTEEALEFMMTEKGVRMMNPFNRAVEPPFEIPAKTYLEILVSPVRFAREWKLIDATAGMDELMKAVRK